MQLNLAKTKEIIVDYKKKKSPPSPVCISGSNVGIVEQYRYPGRSEAVYKNGLSRLYFLRRLRSFNVCNKLLYMFLSVCCGQHSFLCGGVLGFGDKEKSCQQAE